MLKKINEGGVASDNGFSIQIIGSEILEYKCNNDIVRIDMGYDPKKRIIYIYAGDITQWSSSSTQSLIADDKRRIIVNNIKEAVRLLTGNFKVV